MIFSRLDVKLENVTSQSASTSPSGNEDRRGLLKALGMWFGIAAAVGNTIAAGIVRTPGNIAELIPSEILFLGVWLIGGLYALCGASSLAELAVAIPRSGGQYNYSRRALGDYAGFVVGWSDWLSSCGTLAAVAIVISEYASALIPSLSSFSDGLSVSVIVAFAILQWNGVSWGSTIQMVTSLVKTAAFLVLVAACFLLGSPDQTTPLTSTAITMPQGWALVTAVVLSLQAVFYTIDGWNGVVYFGEEIKDPQHAVPRAIFGSVISVTLIYLLLNAAVLYVIPIKELAGDKFALGTAATRVFGLHGEIVIRVIMIVSLLSCVNAVQLFCSRIIYGMSCDRLFFKRVSEVNSGGTPTVGLLLSTIVGVIFVLGSFERVIAMLSFFFVANYSLSYLSLFVLRAKEPSQARPYRAWGYPWTTGLALFVSAFFLIGSLFADHENAPLALAILAASFPVFKIMKRLQRKNAKG